MSVHCGVIAERQTELATPTAHLSTAVCKSILSVKHILPECPITTELFQEDGHDHNACNNVRDILYNTDIINYIVKLIVHTPVGIKLL